MRVSGKGGRSLRFRGRSSFSTKATSGNGPDDDKRLRSGRDRVGQWSIGRFVGQILLAGEEAQERPALPRDLVADRTAQHGITALERVEDRVLRYLTLDLKLQFVADLRQRSQMLRENYSDHICAIIWPLHILAYPSKFH